jgi:hypothetical protein
VKIKIKTSPWEAWVRKTSDPTPTDVARIWDLWKEKGGWVYVARVGQHDTLWKIGKTGRANPFERVFHLERAVSATETFDLVWASLFVNRHEAEAEIHKKMKRLGMHRNKEFFEGPLEIVKQCLESYGHEERERWSGWNIDGWRSGLERIVWSSQAFDWDAWWESQENREFQDGL